MNIDDPKLTAYALNELDESDRAQIEALLAHDPEARRHVEEIRQTATMLSANLAAVPTPSLTPHQRQEIAAAAAVSPSPGTLAATSPSPGTPGEGRGEGLVLPYEPVTRRQSFWRRTAKWSAITAAACAALAAVGYPIYARQTRASAAIAQLNAQVTQLRGTRDKLVEERHKLNTDLTDALSKLEAERRAGAKTPKPAPVPTALTLNDRLSLDPKFSGGQSSYLFSGNDIAGYKTLSEVFRLGPGPNSGRRLFHFGGGGSARTSTQLLVPDAVLGETITSQIAAKAASDGFEIASAEPKIPYEDILRYPQNWPDISELRNPDDAIKYKFRATSGEAVTGGLALSGGNNGSAPAIKPTSPQTTNGGQIEMAAGTVLLTENQKLNKDLNDALLKLEASQRAHKTAEVQAAEAQAQIANLKGKVQSSGIPLNAIPQRVGEAPRAIDVRKQEVELRTKLSLTKARQAIAAGNQDAARESLENARVAIESETTWLTPQELTALKGDLALVQAEVNAPANEAYASIHDNPFHPVLTAPLSTFSIDVDTASYSNVRRFIAQNQLPPADAVRIEEMLNYFPYDYKKPLPNSPDPFAADVEVAGCPWNPESRLVRVAVKGKEIAHDKRPVSNLVFLIDVSGSMNEPRKLPLVKEGLKLMVNELTENDRVGIVVYAGAAGLVLPSTPADPKNKEKILAAIDNLSAGGSTNGGQGVELAYRLAAENFIKGGTNRVILATDGDWNVGITDQTSLVNLIEEKAKSNVFLSLLGFGFGNLKDATLEKLADKGNGHYAYIDDVKEAKKVLVEEMSGTLVTIAKDMKVQIEFNPTRVASYRLIGYENRILRKEDFNNDKIDAGEIGAGHAVTALYEVVLAKAPTTKPATQPTDDLKYQKTTVSASPELLTLKLRYKQPDGDTSKLIEIPATDAGVSYAKASDDFKFAAAVAQFGMILRNSPHKGTASLDGVIELADEGKAKDEMGYRGEFVELVKKTKALVKK